MMVEPNVEMKRDAHDGYKFLDTDRTMNVLDWIIFLRDRAHEDSLTISVTGPDNFLCTTRVIHPEDSIPNELKPYFLKKVSSIIWRLGLSSKGNLWIFIFDLSCPG